MHRPKSLTARARQAIAAAGGIACSHHIAERLDCAPRRIRDLLRRGDGSVVHLGAGYFALRHAPFAPLVDFTEHWLRQHGPQRIDDLVDVLGAHYPNGNRRSIHHWLLQEPGRIQRRPGTKLIELTPQHWKSGTP